MGVVAGHDFILLPRESKLVIGHSYVAVGLFYSSNYNVVFGVIGLSGEVKNQECVQTKVLLIQLQF
jgi:hypothetical protein